MGVWIHETVDKLLDTIAAARNRQEIDEATANNYTEIIILSVQSNVNFSDEAVILHDDYYHLGDSPPAGLRKRDARLTAPSPANLHTRYSKKLACSLCHFLPATTSNRNDNRKQPRARDTLLTNGSPICHAQGDIIDGVSVGGYCALVWGVDVSWGSAKTARRFSGGDLLGFLREAERECGASGVAVRNATQTRGASRLGTI
ncbi:hypothetical protein MMC21_007021 [Puttea exsequens]|nr:hypothetical protein [Puttea exsequens]